MTSQNHHKLTQFWFGFALGTVAIGAGAFLFGTKKGRSVLKNLMEYSENLEENLVSLGEEIGEGFGDKQSTHPPQRKRAGQCRLFFNADDGA